MLYKKELHAIAYFNQKLWGKLTNASGKREGLKETGWSIKSSYVERSIGHPSDSFAGNEKVSGLERLWGPQHLDGRFE